jgi:hypothetical protein
MSRLQSYIERYKRLHDAVDAFKDGKGNLHYSAKLFDGKNFEEKLWKHVKPIIATGTSFSVLDYGCGKALHYHKPLIDGKSLVEQFGGKLRTFYLYDPGYEPYSEPPSYEPEYNMVFCADVMEHIPEEDVSSVLEDIEACTKHGALVFFSIAGAAAFKSFSDGENLHCTVKPINWWIEQIEESGIVNFLIVHTDEKGEKTYKSEGYNASV